MKKWIEPKIEIFDVKENIMTCSGLSSWWNNFWDELGGWFEDDNRHHHNHHGEEDEHHWREY